MSRLDLREFLSGFLAEAGEHLRAIRANLVLVDDALQRGEGAPRPVRELFRSLHTIKGLAGMVDVAPIVELAHAMESVLRTAERAGGRLPTAAFAPLVEGTEAIALRVRALGEGVPVPAAPEALLERLARLEAGAALPPTRTAAVLDPALDARLTPVEREQVAAAGRAIAEISFAPSRERAAAGLTITSVRGRLAEVGEIVKVVPVSSPTADGGSGMRFVLVVITSRAPAELAASIGVEPADVRQVEIAAPPPTPLAEEPFDHDASGPAVVRVPVERVDETVDGLSALLVTRMRLSREIDALAAAGADVRELRRVTTDLTRQLGEMRRAVVGLRMLSVAELLQPLPLLVRGLRASTGKDVELVVDVGRVEVDKAVAERLWPAVVHLVRNAVDHGIETATERRAAGKRERGTITVRSAQLGSGRLELSIEDDGRGVDRARIAARAGKPEAKTQGELLDLLTAPGFSTRDRADATSGRGMGLDIVRRSVEELGGELALEVSATGGTRFTVRAPVTVAVIDAVAFTCDAQVFLVPVAAIEELVEVAPGDPVTGPAPRSASRRTAILPIRGAAVPWVDLGAALGLRPAGTTPPRAVLVRREGRLFAFGVDRLMGHHAVVVRPLRDPLVTVPGVSGATDLGDGRPTLILDLPALAPTATREERAA